MRPTPTLLALLGALAAFPGCETDRKAPPTPSLDPTPIESYPRVVALDGLGPFLGVSAPTVDRSTAAMRVTVPVRSLTDEGELLRVQYRFVFLDDRGRPVEPEESWRYVVIPWRTQVFMDSNALTSDAVDWRLEIRSAR